VNLVVFDMEVDLTFASYHMQMKRQKVVVDHWIPFLILL